MTGKIDDDEVLFWHISQSERRFGLQYSLLLIILEHKVNQYLLPDFQMNSDFPSEKKKHPMEEHCSILKILV